MHILPHWQVLTDHDTLLELCETWQQQEQQSWTSAELQRRRARLALEYSGEQPEDEVFGEQVSMIYGAATKKPGYKVRQLHNPCHIGCSSQACGAAPQQRWVHNPFSSLSNLVVTLVHAVLWSVGYGSCCSCNRLH